MRWTTQDVDRKSRVPMMRYPWREAEDSDEELSTLVDTLVDAMKDNHHNFIEKSCTWNYSLGYPRITEGLVTITLHRGARACKKYLYGFGDNSKAEKLVTGITRCLQELDGCHLKESWDGYGVYKFRVKGGRTW